MLGLGLKANIFGLGLAVPGFRLATQRLGLRLVLCGLVIITGFPVGYRYQHAESLDQCYCAQV